MKPALLIIFHLVTAGHSCVRSAEKNIPAIEVYQAGEVRKTEYICALIPASSKDTIDTPVLIPLVVRVRIGWV